MAEPRRIDDRYVLDEQVGVGPLGTVWRGRMTGGEGFVRRVAIKQLRPELAANDTFATLLALGAGRLMETATPHVERVVDIVSEGDECFLIVEWVEGPSLKRWVTAYHQRGKPAPWALVLAIAADVLFALHALHTRPRPLVHGCVSTGCIRLDRSGMPVVGRFGVRPAIEGAKVDHAWAESEGLAIEAGMSAAADVFAMGLTLYTVLAGATCVSDLPEELRALLMAGKPADLGRIRDDIPPVVLRTVERSLSKNPQRRFESASDMARSLRLILGSLPQSTDPPAIAHAIEEVLPRRHDSLRAPASTPADAAAPLPPAPSAAPPASSSSAEQPIKAPTGLKAAATDQLDLEDLSQLTVDDD